MKYSALVAALLALSLTACGEKPAEAPVAPAPVAAPAVEAAPADAAVDAASAPAAPAAMDSVK